MNFIPLATYRIQFTKKFTFDDAARIAPYLKQFGITHLYASPFLKARSGSTHGYDIVDHNAFNPELGGTEGFARLSAALRAQDLGLILDFVPNHMGIGLADNAWWLDVLEWGPKSPHAATFDIAWDALPHRRQPGVLLPILGKPYGDALQSGELVLKYDASAGEFAVWYFEHKLPVTPPGYGEILRQVVGAAHAADTDAGRALLALASRYNGPNRPNYREAPALKRELAAISGADDVITRGLSAFRADDDTGIAGLHRLLERQNYRLASWRIAFSAINYRRFFDVNDLAGIRMEHPQTLRATHPLVARLIADGQLQGLRLDHIDGLYDPMQYTRRLRQLARELGQPELYVTVEKILEDGEALPAFTGVAGTTGYEWLNAMSHLLVDATGLAPLDQTWRNFTGESRTLTEMLDEAKSRVLDTMLASEFTVLTERLSRIAAGHYSTRDYTDDRLRAALKLYVLEFPVYRTYVTAARVSETDRALIAAAIARARKRWRGPDPDIFNLLAACLNLDLARDTGYSAARVRAFAMKLQQFTGPLMAKALEDTTFYRHHRLLALNEVGGSPDAKPLTAEAFHGLMQARAEQTPHGLTASATHDTKRGEDARMRILALSQIPRDWEQAVQEWRALNAPLKTQHAGRAAPSPAHEYMLYQTLVGSWPGASDETYADRIAAYALKAAREGKQETSWTNPDETYETALKDFVKAMLQHRPFLDAFTPLAARTSLLGALSSLSQLTLEATMPGVPDFYQGTELWDLSLVDPDNRRPVDFAQRAALLSKTLNWAVLAKDWRSGAIKFHLANKFMELRRAMSDVFLHGDYQPVELDDGSPGVVSFARTRGRSRVMVLIGRHFAGNTGGGRHWPTEWLGQFTVRGRHSLYDVFTNREFRPGETVRLIDLFSALPLAVLRTQEK